MVVNRTAHCVCMIGCSLKIMIGCISGRCLAESQVVAGLRLSCHSRDSNVLDLAQTIDNSPLADHMLANCGKFSSFICCWKKLAHFNGFSKHFYSKQGNFGGILHSAASIRVIRASVGTNSDSFFKSSPLVSGTSLPGFKGESKVQGCTTCGGGDQTVMENSNGATSEHIETEAAASVSETADQMSSLPGIICPPMKTVGKSTNIVWQKCMVKREERQKLLGQKGCVIWITGLSGSGKSTLACTLDHAILKRGKMSYVLDGDNVRHGLNNNLGFCAEDRAENIRRIGEVSKLFVDAGIICIVSCISPYRSDRDACRKILKPGEFIEVFMDFPVCLCEERDPKGLYKLARAGKIKGFTGVDDPYEAPIDCEMVMKQVNGKCPTPADMAESLISYLERREFLGSQC